MTVRLRFAPSPTGFIHVGNIRTALMNALFARQNGGIFFLRLDDTDLERSTQEFAQAIKEDLIWLGLNFDETFTQSSRMARYDEVKQQLIDAGRLYPCFETSEELDFKRKRQLARKRPPVYDRSSLELTDEQKAQYESEGRKPHWRFKLNEGEIVFQDMIRGEVRIDPATVSDPVLIRADGSYLYTLCSVIDDMDYKISHIIRGEDHVTNTATQIQIFEALGSHIPTFAHHPLLTDAQGEKLSKRIGGLSIRSLREKGFEPQTILSYLARIGTSDSVVPRKNVAEIADGFDIARTSHSPARFVPQDMENLNSQIVSLYEFADVESRIKSLVPQANKEFWEGVKHNIKFLSEVQSWGDIVFTAPEKVDLSTEKEFLQVALDKLPSEEISWNADIWKLWTKDISEATGRKGKNLFMPLRLALTSMEHGPEMSVMILLLGRDEVIQRLKAYL